MVTDIVMKAVDGEHIHMVMQIAILMIQHNGKILMVMDGEIILKGLNMMHSRMISMKILILMEMELEIILIGVQKMLVHLTKMV